MSLNKDDQPPNALHTFQPSLRHSHTLFTSSPLIARQHQSFFLHREPPQVWSSILSIQSTPLRLFSNSSARIPSRFCSHFPESYQLRQESSLSCRPRTSHVSHDICEPSTYISGHTCRINLFKNITKHEKMAARPSKGLLTRVWRMLNLWHWAAICL